MLSLIEAYYKTVPRNQPLRPPEIDIKYASFKGKVFGSSLEEAKSNVHKEYQEYFDDKWATELYNRDTFLKMFELWQEGERKDQALGKKLSEFREHIDKYPTDAYLSLQLNWAKYKFPYQRSNEIVGWQHDQA